MSTQFRFAFVLTSLSLASLGIASCSDNGECTANCGAQGSSSSSSGVAGGTASSSSSGAGGEGGASSSSSSSGSSSSSSSSGSGGAAGGGFGGNAVLPIDPAFNGGQLVTTAMRDGDDDGRYMFRLADGKLVVVGLNQSNLSMLVARFEANGALDTTFGIGGRVLVPGPLDGIPGGAAVAPDGRIVFGWSRLRYGGVITALTADGKIDETFGTKGQLVLTDMFSNAMIFQADGKLVLAGGMADPMGKSPFRMRRFTGSGTVDSSFGVNGTLAIDSGDEAATGQCIALDANGRFIVPGGPFNMLVVRRVTSAGALDSSFNATGFATSSVVNPGGIFGTNAVAVQNDGKIIIGVRENNGSKGAVIRFTTAGAVDTSFDGDGIATIAGISAVDSVAANAAGQIYATSSNSLVRLTSTGAADATFASTGTLMLPFSPSHLVTIADGSAFVAGGTQTYSAALAHVKVDGTFDAAFGMAGTVIFNIGASGDGIFGLGLQPDGKILAAGQAIAHAPITDGWVAARYLADGKLDTSFATNGKLFSAMPQNLASSSMAVDSTGKFVLTGGFLTCIVARFTANGAVDGSFGINGERDFAFLTGKSAGCLASAFDATGRVVVVGSSGSGAGVFGVARLDTNGSLDTTFAGTGATSTAVGIVNGGSTAFAMAIQKDGKIVAAGRGPTAMASTGFAIARYLEDGTLDTAFDTDGKLALDIDEDLTTTSEAVRAVVQQSDDKLVLVGFAGNPISGSNGISPGSFLGNSGEFARLVIARLLPNGARDTSFGVNGVTSLNFGYQVVMGRAAKVNADGTMYVAGDLYDGLIMRGVMTKLLADGTVDSTFGEKGLAIVPTNETSSLGALLLQPDGKVLVGGSAFINPTGSDFALLRLP